MDSHSILDHDSGDLPISGESQKSEPVGNASPPGQPDGNVRFPGEDGGRSLAEMAERDLTATLQLLAERAQYITGASGAAIALRDHEEMVCRASAGSSAPEVGAQLQVNSGLSGESVRTKQTLRCDDATTDERVNRESCEALGIRSVVVMPLLRGDDVIGVFELFSDQANIFQTRDLAALERMGAMVHTALEHSAAALGLAPLPAEEVAPTPPVNGHDPDASSHGFTFADDQSPSYPNPAATEDTFSAIPTSDNGHETASPIDDLPIPAALPDASPGIAFHMKMPARPADSPAPPDCVAAPSSMTQEDVLETKSEEADILEAPIERSPVGEFSEDILDPEPEPSALAQPAPILSVAAKPPSAELPSPAREESPPTAARGAVATLKKCESCGFPVSEGRRLCLDCEKKSASQGATTKVQSSVPAPTDAPLPPSPEVSAPTPVAAHLPNFLGSDEPEASWLATHKFMVVAIVLAVIGIIAAVMLR